MVWLQICPVIKVLRIFLKMQILIYRFLVAEKYESGKVFLWNRYSFLSTEGMQMMAAVQKNGKIIHQEMLPCPAIAPLSRGEMILSLPAWEGKGEYVLRLSLQREGKEISGRVAEFTQADRP